MTTVNMHEAKTHLSRLVERVENGEEIIIARAGRPVARLTSLNAQTPEGRRPGIWKGKVQMMDDFDDELPAEIAAAFRGELP